MPTQTPKKTTAQPCPKAPSRLTRNAGGNGQHAPRSLNMNPTAPAAQATSAAPANT